MRRHTIAGLMLMVLACAVAVAALRYASELWVTVVLDTALILLGCLVFGVAYRTGARRAGWLGFLVFGGGYVAIAFTPWGAELKTNLPVTRLLVRLDETLHPPAGFVGETIMFTGSGPQNADGTVAVDSFIEYLPVAGPASARLKLFYASSQREHFLAVGHGLCGLMIGLMGSIIARRFHRASGETA
jgi:hypothetical protein